ncbi:dihydropteroate synthase [Streptomyces sp. NPDC005813]|uniref:dihydropteroate synthase n=1 Tax=Streptomyces sp. NPDC005813 TaxID=3155592 RepID=UPI0033C7AE95
MDVCRAPGLLGIDPGGTVMTQHLDCSPMALGRPLLVGAVTMTADSFPDGGRYLAAEGAVGRARRLRSEGADIIELGPAAGHLGAQEVGAAEEIRRLAGVMDQVVAERVPVSVDSLLPEFQRFAAARRSPAPERHPGLSRSRLVRGTHGLWLSAERQALRAAACTSHRSVDRCHRSGQGNRGVRRRASGRAGNGRHQPGTAGISRERLVADPGPFGPSPEPAFLGSVRRLWRRSCTRHGTERITSVPMTWASPTMRSPSSTPGIPPKEEHDGSARSDRRGGATQGARARHPAGSAGQAVRILGAPERHTRTG